VFLDREVNIIVNLVSMMCFAGSGGRRRILDSGNLIISPVSRDDDGIYTCIAENQYGKDESFGRLIVLREYWGRVFLPKNVFLLFHIRDIIYQCCALFGKLNF
jgi:hypothetical protein